MRLKKFLLCFLILLCVATPSYAQLWSGLLDPSRAVNWGAGYQGVEGGIPNRTTICSTFNPGATAAQINSAIAACPSGQVVFLNAGTYNLTSGLIFNNKDNVTLRGAGPNQTILNFTGNTGCGGPEAAICFFGNSGYEGAGNHTSTNWTAGYAKGTTQITLASVSGLSVGSIIILDQLDDTSDSGGVLVCSTISSPLACSYQGGSGAGRTSRAQEQRVKVVAITGSVVTIDPPLAMPNWRASQSPQAWWTGSHAEMDGVEYLTINNLNSGARHGITFFNAYNCWLKGIQNEKSLRANIELYLAGRIEVRDSYLYGVQTSGSQSYGVEFYQTSNNLIINNVLQTVTSPIQLTHDVGSVVAYNFMTDNYFTLSGGTWLQTSPLSHDAGVAMELIEGNDNPGLQADLFHGTSSLMTGFRNRWDGKDPGSTTGTKTQNTMPVQIQAKNRFFNIIGNVLGWSGYHNDYAKVYNTQPAGNCATTIYALGFAGQQCSADGGGITNDTRVRDTTMRWGNYDVVTGTSRFLGAEVPSLDSILPNPVPLSNILPASLFLAARPSWFGYQGTAIAWPPIGPDVTSGDISGVGGHAYKIPARRCYEAMVSAGTTNGNGAYNTFNPTGCYRGVGGGTAPSAPANLRVQ